MRRAALAFAAFAALAASACDLVATVPRAQAARDLGCPEAEVHVVVGLRAQIASGCGRSLTYVEVCDRGGEKSCRFEAVRSWALSGTFR
jgi:hypothetical protein